MSVTETKDGVIIDMFVKPRQRQFELRVEEGQLVVLSTEEPTKGKVNKEIIKRLSKLFNARTELVSGATSRQKRILIVGASRESVVQILNEH